MKYIIIDPCYFPHTEEQWDEFCEQEPRDIHTFLGLDFLKCDYTPNGDGEYEISGQSGCVDSGILALVAVPDDYAVPKCGIDAGRNVHDAEVFYHEAMAQL